MMRSAAYAEFCASVSAAVKVKVFFHCSNKKE